MNSLPFLPATREEVDRLGWTQVDAVLVTGDAYVDHPSFGTAVIGRALEHGGYRVAVLAMPPWRVPGAATLFGRPRLFFGVSSGNVDSTLSRWTAFGKVRNDDPYAPGGVAGHRPERAVIQYCNMIRASYKDVPIVIGGIEASMRRMAHYDFRDDRVRRSVLLDSKANILVYGMGEDAVLEIARRIGRGEGLSGIPGTVELRKEAPMDALLLPPEEEVCAEREAYGRFYKFFYENQHRVLAQPTAKRFLVHHPPPAKTTMALDELYGLPFAGKPHPVYGARRIPAFEMIRNSVNAHRGCVSGCAFCSLGLHQGKRIVRRSEESVLEEISRLSAVPEFSGHITDIGGPSANMYGCECAAGWKCERTSCTWPKLCPNLKIHTGRWMKLMADAGRIPGITGVTVGSGIRYDLFMRDDRSLLAPLVERHVGGQMKIAPEHTVPRVLRCMRKEPLYPLADFSAEFSGASKRLGIKRYLLPYLMSCHPGCTEIDMRSLRKDTLEIFGFLPEQVQAFIPLPLTLSSVMYWTGRDPLTAEEVFVERDAKKRGRQHNAIAGRRSGKR